MTFNGETVLGLLNKLGLRFIGPYIASLLSNIKHYRYQPNLSYRCIPS